MPLPPKHQILKYSLPFVGGVFALIVAVKSNVIYKPDMTSEDELRASRLIGQYFDEFSLYLSKVSDNLGKKDLRPLKEELFKMLDEEIAREKDKAPWNKKSVMLKKEDKELLWKFFIWSAFNRQEKQRVWGKA